MDIVERLNGLIGQGHYHELEFEQAKAEIERLREALRAIDRKNDNPAWFNPDIHEIIEAALQQKDTE